MSQAVVGRMVIEVAANLARLEQNMGQAARTVTTQMEGMRRDVTSSLNAIESRAKAASQAVLASLGAIGGIEIAKRLSLVADEYANIQAKIKLAVKDQNRLAAANDRVYETAQKTYTSYDSIATVVGRTTRALEAMGVKNEAALALSQQLASTVSKGLQISGATATEAAASVLQLSQALASGKLAGDEFRSFAENAPRLMVALADSLGVPIGKLREMSKEGKLTTDVVVKGLIGAAGQIDREFQDVPLTIGRAWQQMRNDVTKFVGETADATGVANALATAIQAVGRNLGAIATGIGATAMVMLSRSIASAVASIVDWIAKTRAQIATNQAAAAAALQEAQAKQALAIATINATRTQIAGIAAKQAELASSMALINGLRMELTAKMAAIAADMNKARAAIAAASANGAHSLSLRVVAEETARLTALQTANAAIVNELAVLGQRAAAVEASQVAAKNSLAAAQARLTAAQSAGATAATAAATAATAAATATTVAGTALRTLGTGMLALVGGPIGALIIGLGAVAYAMYSLDKATTTAEEAVDNMITKYEEMAARARAAVPETPELINKEQANLELQLLEQIANKKKEVDALMQRRDSMVGSKGGIEIYSAQLTAAAGDVERLEGKLKQLREASAQAAVANMHHNEYLRKQQAELLKLAGSIEPVVTGTEDQEDAVKKLNKAMEAAMKVQDQYDKKYATWLKTSREAFRSLENQLDPLIELNNEYEKAKNVIAEYAMAFGKEAKTAAEVERALKLLNQQYEKRKKEIESTLNPQQQLLKDMEQEIVLLGLSEEARRVEAEVMRVSDGLSQAEIQNLREQVAARQSVITAMEEYNNAVRETNEIVENGMNDMATAFGDFIANGADDFSSFADELKNIAKRMVADMIAQFIKLQVIGPIMRNLMGGGGGGGMNWAGMAMSAMGMGGGGGSPYTGGNQGGAAGWGQWAANMGMNYIGGGAGGTGFGGGTGMGSSFATSPMFEYAPAVAGVAGLYYGYTNRGSNVGSSALAGLSYGALGVAGAGALAGAAGAAALGGTAATVGGISSAAVAGGTSSLAALGSAAWVPVVGWILAIAALVDMVSGGKLFGTKYKPKEITSQIGFDQQGGVASLTRMDERQRSLFRGRQRRTVEMEAPEEAVTAANNLYNSIKKVMVQSAKQLGIEVPALITGSFTQVYDKKGKLKEEFFTIAGKKYEEDFESFQKRLTAENIIAAVDASIAAMGGGAQQFIDGIIDTGENIGNAIGGGGGDRSGDLQAKIGGTVQAMAAYVGEANAIAERWRGSADALLDGAQFLLAAQTAIVKGVGLLGDTGTLTETTNLVEELQQGGESLIETYSRLYQQSEALTSALDFMNVSLGMGREEFVRFADDIATAAGGLQQAQALWDAYFKSFYSSAEQQAAQLRTLGAAADSSLAPLGLSRNTSLEEARAIFETKLPTLTAEQIVEWLKALGVLAQYTQATRTAAEAQAQAAQQYEQLMSQFRTTDLSPFRQELYRIAQAERQAVKDANALAQAAGRQGASERDLAAIHRWAASQAAAAINTLKANTADLISQLYGGKPGTMSEIDRRIQELESKQSESVSGQIQGNNDVYEAAMERYEAELEAIKSIKDYLDSMLLSDKSPLNPYERLVEAQRQLDTQVAAARGGDLEALKSLPQFADAFLTEAQSFYGMNDDYMRIFNGIRAMLQSFGMTTTRPTATGGGSTVSGGGNNSAESAELAQLRQWREEMRKEEEARNRLLMAQQLAQNLGDLAMVLNQPVFDLVETMGVDLTKLVADLGINLSALTETSAVELGAIAEMLGVSLPALAANLNVPMTDLVTATGISLENISLATAQSLAELAGSLGMELTDLASSVGVDLGALGDEQSLLNDALEAQLVALGPKINDYLGPLLSNVENAVTEADANAAIAELEAAVSKLPPGVQDALAPFLPNIDGDADGDWYLAQIAGSAGEIPDLIETTNQLLNDIARAVGRSQAKDGEEDEGEGGDDGGSGWVIVPPNATPDSMGSELYGYDESTVTERERGKMTASKSAVPDMESFRVMKDELARLGTKLENGLREIANSRNGRGF